MNFDDLPDALAADRDGAFAHMIRALQDDVYSGVLRMLGNAADAEDVTQEAFVRAYEALSGYPPERIRALRIRPWLWTIAANQARNRARSRRRKPEAWLHPDSGPPEERPGPEDAALANEGLRAVAEALTKLPWAIRSAVVLRHVLDMPYDDIAGALGRPTGTVKSDVHRGLERLRAALERGETT
jgi:RNA polymerase sigma-70 factor (ECF subfamily)